MKRLLLLLCIVAQSFAQTNSARMLSGVNAQTGTSYTFVAADSTRITTFANASAIAVSLPSGTTANFGAGAVFSAKNIGSGTVTITCASCTITSQATAAATMTLASGQNADLYSDGVNYVAFVPPVITGTSLVSTVGYSGRYILIYNDVTTGPVQVGHGQAPIVLGTNAQIASNGIDSPGRSYTSAASASGNILAGVEWGWGAGLGADSMSFGPIFRYSIRLLLNNSTNVRYWIGLTDGATGDIGGGGNGLATDTPNRQYAMFRFSAGTDATIKAIAGRSNVLQTVVDTGLAPDTVNTTLFEIVPVGGGTGTITAYQYYINGALVATISTTIPLTTDRIGSCWVADNKNTNTAVGATFYSSYLALR